MQEIIECYRVILRVDVEDATDLIEKIREAGFKIGDITK